ncbi:MAG: hypothetical protein FWC28_07045 [Proteobacteria bacterium]|nr:hypothetical protein [Pseudomonadota bacterium]
MPSSHIPPGMPPGMFPETQAELNKANWTLGLGIASFFCCGLLMIPALILGWPTMKSAQNPLARSRAKIGVILSLVAIGIQILFSILYLTIFVTAFSKLPLEALEKEIHRIDKDIRELPSGNSLGKDDDDDGDDD